MANLVLTIQTRLEEDEVMVKVIQFFTEKRWNPHTQLKRKVVFTGKPTFPVISLILLILTAPTIIGPIIFGIRIISKVGTKWFPKLSTLTVSVNPLSKGTELNIEYPKHAKSVVNKFSRTLSSL